MKKPQPHSATRARVRPVAQSHDFRLGFVPMIDGAPVIVAHEMGLFRKFGVRVRLGREAGWASIRDRLIHQEIVGAHAPASMAFALRCGLGSLAVPCLTAIVLAHNGSAITLSQTLKRAGAVDPLSLAEVVRRSGASRRYRFAAVFEYATQHVNLRRWLAAGGVLGRQIKVIKEDGASDWPTFAEKAKKLLVKDKVASVFGCWTSASRKAVLPVFEKENGMLYYPTFYEGLEQSKNVIYTGQEATQQIIAGLDWIAKEKKAKTFYLIGSDYIWPRTSAKIARKHIENVLKGTVVGEEFYALGHTQFGSLINKIKLKKPDVIYAIVVGGSNVSFYKQLKAAGITSDKQTLLTISVTEDEVLGIGGENLTGFYSAMKYFQSQDNPNNAAFVKAFKEKYGEKSVIGDVTQAGYLGPWLWKATVEKAGSFDVDKIAAASSGVEFKGAPEGYVRIHDTNHHLWSKLRIGQWSTDGQAKVLYESALIEPDPFPKGYQ